MSERSNLLRGTAAHVLQKLELIGNWLHGQPVTLQENATGYGVIANGCATGQRGSQCAHVIVYRARISLALYLTLGLLQHTKQYGYGNQLYQQWNGNEY